MLMRNFDGDTFERVDDLPAIQVPRRVRAKLRPMASHRAPTISPAWVAMVLGMAVAVFLVGLLVGRMF